MAGYVIINCFISSRVRSWEGKLLDCHVVLGSANLLIKETNFTTTRYSESRSCSSPCFRWHGGGRTRLGIERQTISLGKLMTCVSLSKYIRINELSEGSVLLLASDDLLGHQFNWRKWRCGIVIASFVAASVYLLIGIYRRVSLHCCCSLTRGPIWNSFF